MPQTVVLLAGADAVVGNFHTVQLPAGVVAGERLSVYLSMFANSAPPIPSGWNMLCQRVGSSILLAYFWKTADGSETEVVFDTYPNNPKNIGGSWISERRSGHDPNAAPVCYLDGAGRAGFAANTQSPNPPTLSSPWSLDPADYVAVAVWRPAPVPSPVVTFGSYPTGYDNDQANALFSNNAGSGIAIASVKDSVNGVENPPAFGLSSMACTVAQTVAHKSL